jgi:hypothetical protein
VVPGGRDRRIDILLCQGNCSFGTALITRIALVDGPLRDIQLLGFAALIIAAISQVLEIAPSAMPANDLHWSVVCCSCRSS